MDIEDLRPAKFDAYYVDETPITCNEKNGFFHRWAEDAFMTNEYEYYRRVSGIVEDADGKVYKVPPEHLTLFRIKTKYEKAMELMNDSNV